MRSLKLLSLSLALLLVGAGLAPQRGLAGDGIPQTEAASATAKFETVAKTDAAYTGALDAKDMDGARKLVGKTGAFKGKVVKAFGTRNITVLNFAANFRTALTAALRKEDFGKFPALAELEGKEVLISGKFSEYDGRPQIMLTDSKQIRLVK
jgi:hypothetical protein